MTNCSIGRFVSALTVLALSASSVLAQSSGGAFFCQGQPGKGWAYAAIREIPDGDVQFAIHKWRRDGQFFGVHGIAQWNGEAWIYKERNQQSHYDSKTKRLYDADLDPNEFPTCKLAITWSSGQHLRFEIDETASCDAHAGAGFYDKATEFGPVDFDGSVKNELDDHDNFNTSGRCVMSKRSRTPRPG